MVRLKPDTTFGRVSDAAPFCTLQGEDEMSRTLALLFTLLTLLPSRGLAQTAEPPKWDFSATTGLFSGRPSTAATDHYGERWYASARAGVALDADRERAFIPQQYRYLGDGRTPATRETRWDSPPAPESSWECSRLRCRWTDGWSG